MYPGLSPLNEVDDFLMQHMPTDKHDVLNTLKDVLPLSAHDSLQPLIHRIDSSAIFCLIAAISPSQFRAQWLTDATPETHKLVLELIESA